jgi:hypothetical protein
MNIQHVFAVLNSDCGSFIHIHTHKNRFFNVHTTTSFNTRLNAEKFTFSGVYMRFCEILSAWEIALLWETSEN